MGSALLGDRIEGHASPSQWSWPRTCGASSTVLTAVMTGRTNTAAGATGV